MAESISDDDAGLLVKGFAHITGGGLFENIPRILPPHLAASLDASTWEVPAVLTWLRRAGKVTAREFARTWNAGLGMVVVVRGEAEAVECRPSNLRRLAQGSSG